MKNIVSCGIIFINNNKILLGHSTGNSHWDIPKGQSEIGEGPLETAIRETKEETGIIVDDRKIKDLNRFQYTKKKDLHLFLSYQKIILKDLICTSYFQDKFGNNHPELDDFDFFSIEDAIYHKTAKNFSRLLSHINSYYLKIK